MTPDQIADIVAQIGERFSTFGGDRDPGNNPIAHAMKGKPLVFAANVSVEDVVRFVAGIAEPDAHLSGFHEPKKQRVVIVCDGKKWHVRRLRAIEHDLDRDEKVYRCDAPISNDHDTLAEAIRALEPPNSEDRSRQEKTTTKE